MDAWPMLPSRLPTVYPRRQLRRLTKPAFDASEVLDGVSHLRRTDASPGIQSGGTRVDNKHLVRNLPRLSWAVIVGGCAHACEAVGSTTGLNVG